jgi:hypothetical protein
MLKEATHLSSSMSAWRHQPGEVSNGVMKAKQTGGGANLAGGMARHGRKSMSALCSAEENRSVAGVMSVSGIRW